MSSTEIEQQPITSRVDDHLLVWVEAFLVDRKAQHLTPGTLKYYREKLGIFTRFCDTQLITRITQITPDTIRRYLLSQEESGHNPGGVHQAYRTLRAFLRWWEAEVEPEGWKNPIKKVKAPKVPDEPIEPVALDTVQAMVEACPTNTFIGTRDRSLLWFLLDTGARAMECLSLNLDDVNPISGTVLIRQGKGSKPRSVFLGQKARKAFRAYLKYRTDHNPAVWITVHGERLERDGLRMVLMRRAKAAGVPVPSPHDFRRAFALNMLRNGVDLISLSRLMGHKGLQVLKRYLRQVDVDLIEAHMKGSPVDHLKP